MRWLSSFNVSQHAWCCACALDWHEPSSSSESCCCFSSCCWCILVGSIHLVFAASLKISHSVSLQKLPVWFYKQLKLKSNMAAQETTIFIVIAEVIYYEKRGATLWRGIVVQREFDQCRRKLIMALLNKGHDAPPIYWHKSQCDSVCYLF